MEFNRRDKVIYNNIERKDMYGRTGICVGKPYKLDTDTYIEVSFFGDNMAKVVNVKNVSMLQ